MPSPPRRTSFARSPFAPAVLKLLVVVLQFVALVAPPATAQQRFTEPAVSKAAAWALGDYLSLAAMSYAQNGDTEFTRSNLAKAERVAALLGVRIKPFPPRPADKIQALASMTRYLLNDDGAALSVALERNYDLAHNLLYEVSSKSNLLHILYAPNDDIGKSIATVIETRMVELGLLKGEPSQLTCPRTCGTRGIRSPCRSSDRKAARRASLPSSGPPCRT